MVTIVLMVLALGGFLQAILSSIEASTVQHEWTLARESARGMIETLQASDFSQVYAEYNSDDADDAGGAGTAHGMGFDVAGLDQVEGDADGLVGEILFPTMEPGGVLELREDLDNKRFQTPRDLNGDGAVDALDHSGDYRLLPVVVRVEWRGPSGRARVELSTLLADYQ